MTPDALLPHERECPKCAGSKVELRAGQANSLGICHWYEDVCARCDGVGIVVYDRRECRSESGTIADGFTRLRNDLALKHAELVASQDQVDALIVENLQLRSALDRQRAVDESKEAAH